MNTILVIDDDDCDHFLFERALSEAGFQCEVIKAFDGIQALEILTTTSKQIDLIVLDINMPRMNGHEFADEYGQHAVAHHPVVVMLTSSDQGPAFEETMTHDFVKDYMLKPLKSDDILDLEKIVERNKNAEDLEKAIQNRLEQESWKVPNASPPQPLQN